MSTEVVHADKKSWCFRENSRGGTNIQPSVSCLYIQSAVEFFQTLPNVCMSMCKLRRCLFFYL